eukprot:s257_g4.t1
MVVAVHSASLQDIVGDAAAGLTVLQYLELRGIRTPATLALISKDEAQFDTMLIQPLLDGWTKADGSKLQVAESDKPIARAVLLHMWLLCLQQWNATQAASQTAPAQAAPSQPATAAPRARPSSFSKCVSREPSQSSKKTQQPANAHKQDQKGYGEGNTKSGKSARMDARHALGLRRLLNAVTKGDNPDILHSGLRTSQVGPGMDGPLTGVLSENVILLSFFDGIGSAALILQELVAGISLYLSWEIDPECIEVLKLRHPQAHHRGDFLEGDPHMVADIIRQHDPEGTMIVLIVSAPPCPDFSGSKRMHQALLAQIDWSKIRHSPLTGAKLRWSKTQRFHRLQHDGELQSEDSMDLQGLHLHHRVASHETRMPCLTTPAPSAGRPPGCTDPEQKARWLNDHRTFAPWQYAEEAMLHGKDGTMSVPSAAAKEQLHQLPKDYTKMLANGWHIGSAKFVMMLVLQMGPGLSRPHVYLPPLPCGTIGRWPRRPAVPRHPAAGGRQLTADAARDHRWHPINAEDLEDRTNRWWKDLPSHVAKVYYDDEHRQIAQIPLLLHLLQLTGMPGLSDLQEDLTQGFQVLGILNPGAGWLPRMDQKYEFPVHSDVFKSQNKHYTLAKLRSKQVDPE